MFKIIDGSKKPKTNKNQLYYTAYIKSLFECQEICEDMAKTDEEIKDLLKKVIVYGVKFINTKEYPEYISKEEAAEDFDFICSVKDMMSRLTPKEFIQIYPISKEYEGHKYGMKDYFYTRDYINTLDQRKPIGDEIMHFLWEFHNWELTDFNVEIMQCMSRINRLNGEPTLAESFADTMGMKTYTMHTDSNGKQFLFDKETGKTTRLRNPKSKHLKLVK